MSGPRNLKLYSLVFALPWLLLSSGCRRPADPQKTFAQVRERFIRGELLPAQTEADAAFRSFARDDQEWAWKFRLLEAEILQDEGLGKDVLSLIDPPLPPELAAGDLAIKRKMLLGSACVLLGRFPEAERSLTEAQALSDASRSSLAGEIIRARGLLKRRQHDPESARRFLRESLQFSRQIHDSHLELTDLLDLGVVAMGEERYDESIDWSNDAYRTAQLLHDESNGEAALGNQGWAYYKMGDFDRALALDMEAEKSAGAVGAQADQISWLNNIGLVLFQQGQFSTAEEYYKRSLALAQKIEAPDTIIDALTSLAFVSVQEGNLTDAQRYGDQAFQLAHARNDRPSELYPLLVKGQVSAIQGNQAEAEKIFHEVADDPKSDLSLRWQAQNDLAGLYEREGRHQDADRQYRQALATIEQARASLQREEFKLPFLANAAHLYDDYVRFLVAQGKTNAALQFADYSRSRTLAEGLGFLPKKSAGVPAALDAQRIARQANATVLFYWLGRKQSYVWAVTATRTVIYPLPPAAEIDAAVQRYNRALLGWQDVLQTANQDGRDLYRSLVEPAREFIPPNSRVILIPDGSLDGLNFETLLAPGPPLHYWIEDATLVNASSLRVLSASQRGQEKGTGKLLLIGDALAASSEYAPLPYARVEMENVEKHFPELTQAYARAQATPAAYESSHPERFSFIHFVAHASASKIDPLDSAIVLSPSSQDQDSFKLHASEIKLHPLHASLVTISSCHGAGTQAYTGEGLVGLSWAFLRAGAHTVIGALWDVSDASTASLMDRLYDGLKRGQPPDVALRSAKLSLLHSEGVVRKPFYWGPFQLYTGR